MTAHFGVPGRVRSVLGVQLVGDSPIFGVRPPRFRPRTKLNPIWGTPEDHPPPTPHFKTPTKNPDFGVHQAPLFPSPLPQEHPKTHLPSDGLLAGPTNPLRPRGHPLAAEVGLQQHQHGVKVPLLGNPLFLGGLWVGRREKRVMGVQDKMRGGTHPEILRTYGAAEVEVGERGHQLVQLLGGRGC